MNCQTDGRMNDLSSIDWNGSKAGSPGQQSAGPKGNYFATLRPTPPTSGRSTPIPALFPSAGQKPATNALTGSRGSTPVNDSFANLVSFNASQSTKQLSLQEQQQKLQEERAVQEAERRKAFDTRFGAAPSLWNSLGDSRTTPGRAKSPLRNNSAIEKSDPRFKNVNHKSFSTLPSALSSQASKPVEDSEGDILAAFNSSAPVDSSSHMPPPSKTNSFASKVDNMKRRTGTEKKPPNAMSFDADDDPFGLGMGPSNGAASKSSAYEKAVASSQDDDDVLGMLSRPVSEFPKTETMEEVASDPHEAKSDNPKIQALNELVDMGFEPAKCKKALDSTESGSDVQGAVGWLLNQAHGESKAKKPSPNGNEHDNSKNTRQSRNGTTRRSSSGAGATKPTWMKEQSSAQRRQDSRSPAAGEKDPVQYAGELKSTLFKTANSLWKSGQKRLNQAVAELNASDHNDPSQPKWMREASQESSVSKVETQRENPNRSGRGDDRTSSRREEKATGSNVTDEALLLEAGGGPPPRQKATTRAKPEPPRESQDPTPTGRSSQRSDRRPDVLPQPKFLQQNGRDPRAKLSRQAVDEEVAAAYISPARRKKTVPRPQTAETEPDLLFNDGDARTKSPSAGSQSTTPAPQRSRPPPTKSLPQRPPPTKRTIPPISSIAMQSSTNSRKAGTEAFKRGDYGSATTEYTKALTAIPPSHPLKIVILSNRALSHSKTGDPKASIADATSVIDLVGSSRGIGETIDLGDGEGAKPMDSYWSKAMLRKAEGLEHLERWTDAAAVWRSCVEAGVGGATSIAGRNRCENAARPKPPPATKKAPPRPKPSALSDLGPASTQSTDAVNRLRAANAAADKLDDEKFRLADIVDGRVSRWRAGKEANLRALLASLENALWDDAGWKKTGMGELIQPNKVKIVYMRGIAKVHPDKVSDP